MNAKEILIAARDKIADERRWTQQAFARDVHGRIIGLSEDPGATCWCAIGAMEAVTAGDRSPRGSTSYLTYRRAVTTLQEASHALGYQGVVRLNDDSDHATVMKMFDKAIEQAGK